MNSPNQAIEILQNKIMMKDREISVHLENDRTIRHENSVLYKNVAEHKTDKAQLQIDKTILEREVDFLNHKVSSLQRSIEIYMAQENET